MKRTLSLLSLCVLPPLFPGAAAGETRNNEMVDIQVVDYAGKPPFKRSSDCVETVDLAQFEVTNEEKTTQFSGRPPFKRH